MEKIHESTCKQACTYFLQLVLTFTPHYIIMVKGLLARVFPKCKKRWSVDPGNKAIRYNMFLQICVGNLVQGE